MLFNRKHKSRTVSQSTQDLRKQAALHRAIAVPMEALEQRRMLSVSTAPWLAPLLETGTTFTLQLTSPNSTNVVTYGYTVKGPATFNGQATTEVDLAISNSDGSGTGSAILHYGKNASGDFVTYGALLNVPGGSATDIYSPYQVGLPATLTAGPTTTFTDSDAQTVTNANGTTTITTVDSHAFTLQSETPTLISVRAGNYEAYQVVAGQRR